MARKPVFFSFHFANDVMRVQQIRNIGMLDGNTPVSPNDWEMIRRSGDAAVQRWIDDNMRYKRCVVVLVGSETASRRWVRYEIEKAAREGKAIIGVHIHNIQCPRTGRCAKGANPFDQFYLPNGQKLSDHIRCYDPDSFNAYQDIARNIAGWIDDAIARRQVWRVRQLGR